MSVRLSPSLFFARSTVWYVLFGIGIFFIFYIVLLLNIFLFIIVILFAIVGALIAFTKYMILNVGLHDKHISLGQMSRGHDEIIGYRLLTYRFGKDSKIHGVCLRREQGDGTTKDYYYMFRDTPANIKQRLIGLDERIKRLPDYTPSLYEEIVAFTKL